MNNEWNKCEDVMPPLDEEVLILYKDKEDELKPDNLFYGLSKRCKDTNFGFEKWGYYTQYQGYYEVVYWMHLPDKPIETFECILDKIQVDIQRLRGCSCSCSDGIIDGIEDILDKYIAEIHSRK